jgi:hypothetical protein
MEEERKQVLIGIAADLQEAYGCSDILKWDHTKDPCVDGWSPRFPLPEQSSRTTYCTCDESQVFETKDGTLYCTRQDSWLHEAGSYRQDGRCSVGCSNRLGVTNPSYSIQHIILQNAFDTSVKLCENEPGIECYSFSLPLKSSLHIPSERLMTQLV